MTCMLFIDPATACGYAAGTRGAMISGEWDCSRTRFDAWVKTTMNVKQNIRKLHQSVPFTHVGYEASRGHKGVDAAHMHGAMVAAIQEVCLELGVSFEAVGVGTLKRFWTGRGNASKDDMVAEAVRRGFTPLSDNEADAIAGWHWMLAAHELIGNSEPAPVAEFREAAE